MAQGQECISPGDSNSDIAGLGILVAFAVQSGLSMIISVWGPVYMVVSKEGSDKLRKLHEKRMQMIDNVSRTICDIQSFSGISLLIAGLSQYKTLTLYHYRLIYDIVNFTGVSYTACFVSRWPTKGYSPHETSLSRPKHLKAVSFLISRGLLLFIFTVFYVAFAIIFGLRLKDWRNDTPGLCYHSENIALSTAAHPQVDRAYLIATSFFMGVALVGCLVFSSRGLKRAIDHASQGSTTGFFLATIFFFGVIGIPLFASLVFVSFGQYPLHLYMAIKIRTANENSLLGDSENSWGFGQIVPLILLIPIIRDIGKAYIEYSEEKAKVAESL